MAGPNEIISLVIPDLDMVVGDEDVALVDINEDFSEESGSRLLGIYARLGNLSEFQSTLKIYELSPAYKLPNGLSYLHLAALSNTSDIFTYLVSEFELNPLFHSDFDQTPLHFAAIVGNIPVIRFICHKRRKSPNVCNQDGIMPLHYACLYGKYESVLCLIDECSAKESPTNSGAWPIHFAAKGGHSEIVKYLANKTSVPSKTKKGNLTPMHFACHEGHISVVSLLMNEYNRLMLPIVTLVSAITSSPLYISLTRGHLDIAECLLTNLSFSEIGPIEVATLIKQFLKAPFVSKFDKKANELLNKFKNIDLCKDVVNKFVKVVFLGNSGAGKSTLTQVLKERSTSVFSSVVGPLCKINEVKPLTTGIVPVKMPQHREFGSIIIHDIAGQIRYLSSHRAILKNLVESSNTVFVLFVNLSDKEQLCVSSIRNWTSLITSDQMKKSLVVVGSYIDDFSKEEAFKRITFLTVNLRQCGILPSTQVIGLDCRKMGGSYLSEFTKAFKTVCFEARKRNLEESLDKSFSLRCHVLYSHLQKLKKQFIKLEQLIELNKQQSITNYLPENINDLQMCLTSLHSLGLIVFLINENHFDGSWIIIEVEMLFSEVNGRIFAPKDFVEHYDGLVSNTGIVRCATLAQVFEYDVDMVVQFLVHSELCIELNPNTLDFATINDQPNPDEKLLFFPALIDETLCITDKMEFRVGLYLSAGHTQFSQPFVHHLMLYLAYKHTLPKHGADHDYNRDCTMWHSGIMWNTNGLCVLVEVVEESQGLIILLAAHEIEKHGKYLFGIMDDVLIIQQKHCPNLSLVKFLMHHSLLQYPIKSPKSLPLYEVLKLKPYYMNNTNAVSCNVTHCTASINALLPFNQTSILVFLEIPEDEIQVALGNPTPPGIEMLFEMYRHQRSPLMEIISVLQFLNHLYADGLIGYRFKEDIVTTDRLSRYEKLMKIFDEVERNLKTSPDPIKFLEKFCFILQKERNDEIDNIAQTMLETINLNWC